MDYRYLYQHPIYAQSNRIGLFCNQTAFDHGEKMYLFDRLIADEKLGRLMIPEHGLFSEFQDQESIQNMSYRGVPCISLYNKSAGITGPAHWMFDQADALLIDIQDAGVRFFTYTTHMFELLEFIGKHIPDMPILIIDRPNQAGFKVEGTLMHPDYKSFLGFPGMIHRHGLTTGGLCRWWMKTSTTKLNIHFITAPAAESNYRYISPSPNLPDIESLQVYPGQCFWEATTFSEGRGTTRPFTLFGHPDLSKSEADMLMQQYNLRFKGISYLRTTSFIPVFHKHKNRVCKGWQLHLENPTLYHSVFSSLWIMRAVREKWPDNFWREGAYEFDSSCSAAQLLLGDDNLIEFVDGHIGEDDLLQKLEMSEAEWIGITVDCQEKQ